MEQKEYLGIIQSKSVYIVKSEEEIISVQKSSSSTFDTTVDAQYNAFSDKVKYKANTVEHSHATTSIYLKNRVLSIDFGISVCEGWHIRTVYLEIGDKRYECGNGISETGVLLPGYLKPNEVLQDLFNSHQGNSGTSIKHMGTDNFGNSQIAILEKNFGTYPEDYPIRRCKIILVLLWLVFPIIYLWFGGFFKNIDSRIIQFILNIKQFALVYIPLTILMTIIISLISGKYKKSRSAKIQVEIDREREKIYAGTGHSTNESFEDAFNEMICKSNEIFYEYLKVSK